MKLIKSVSFFSCALPRERCVGVCGVVIFPFFQKDKLKLVYKTALNQPKVVDCF